MHNKKKLVMLISTKHSINLTDIIDNLKHYNNSGLSATQVCTLITQLETVDNNIHDNFSAQICNIFSHD